MALSNGITKRTKANAASFNSYGIRPIRYIKYN